MTIDNGDAKDGERVDPPAVDQTLVPAVPIGQRSAFATFTTAQVDPTHTPDVAAGLSAPTTVAGTELATPTLHTPSPHGEPS